MTYRNRVSAVELRAVSTQTFGCVCNQLSCRNSEGVSRSKAEPDQPQHLTSLNIKGPQTRPQPNSLLYERRKPNICLSTFRYQGQYCTEMHVEYLWDTDGPNNVLDNFCSRPRPSKARTKQILRGIAKERLLFSAQSYGGHFFFTKDFSAYMSSYLITWKRHGWRA